MARELRISPYIEAPLTSEMAMQVGLDFAFYVTCWFSAATAFSLLTQPRQMCMCMIMLLVIDLAEVLQTADPFAAMYGRG
jgi:hypothetical protein